MKLSTWSKSQFNLEYE